jgi:DNA-binding transcriptional regulator YdaS (Cro superfamily)
MKVDEAVALFGGSRRALAESLGISVQAVAQWGDAVPKLREYQIKEIKEKASNTNDSQ